jgi:hypothetical protein
LSSSSSIKIYSFLLDCFYFGNYAGGGGGIFLFLKEASLEKVGKGIAGGNAGSLFFDFLISI